MKAGGRGGIRTPVTVTRKPDFESGAFNHSATRPAVRPSAYSIARPGANLKAAPGDSP